MKNPNTETVYHHTLPLQLRFNDVDRFGHVNNEVYFSFYDLGKTDYFTKVCPFIDWVDKGMVAAHVEADFLAQIFSTDHIAVQTAVTSIGTKSFTLTQRVIDVDSGEVKCVGASVMVAFDLVKREPMPMCEEWVEAICAYEGRDLRQAKHPAP